MTLSRIERVTFQAREYEPVLKRMNLPEEHWMAKLDKVQPPNKPKIESLVKKMPSLLEGGVSVILRGAKPVGKTSAAAILAKEAKLWGQSVYFTNFWELRDDLKLNNEFQGSDETVQQRVKLVDVLILDNLRAEDVVEKIFLNIRAIEEILNYRKSRRLVTILTTRLTDDQMEDTKELRGLREALSGGLTIDMKGVDMREQAAKQIAKEFLGGAK
jgi:DNA replication protein DnaC